MLIRQPKGLEKFLRDKSWVLADGANRSRLKQHGAERHATELSRVSAEIGREIADTQNRMVIVAGFIGPTSELMEPWVTFPTLLQLRYFMSKPRV